MANEDVSESEEKTMQKPRLFFDFNLGTLIPLFAIGIGGFNYVKGLEQQIQKVDDRGASRIVIADNFYADVKSQLKTNEASPMRLTALETTQKEQADRMDRIVDLFQTGQDKLSTTMQKGFDVLNQSNSTLSTKIEVLTSRFDDSRSKPQKTSFP